MNRSIWSSRSQVVNRHWGYEQQWATMLPLDGKVLYIKNGARTSMKMFDRKDEVLFIQSGRVMAVVADEEIFSKKTAVFRKINLREGDVLNIQAGCPYRLEAIEGNAVVVEISNGHTSDYIRFDDDFGREDKCEKTSLIREKLERIEDDCNRST